MKYGLECEFFVRNPVVGAFVGALHTSLTPDECGFLAEARGKPYDNIREAVFSLKADIHRLEQAAKKLELELVMVPNADVPFEAVMASRRQFNKGVLSFQNLYGHAAHKEKRKKTAGIHISFTKFTSFHYTTKDGSCEQSKSFTYQPMWDYVQIFRHLDKEFDKEIKEARRNPGFYELKHDGRIEYRSLPNTADLSKVIDVIEGFKF